MILAEQNAKLIKKILDRYELDIEVIESEKEALAVGDIGKNKFYKLREERQGFLSLNPVYASDLYAVFRDIQQEEL